MVEGRSTLRLACAKRAGFRPVCRIVKGAIDDGLDPIAGFDRRRCQRGCRRCWPGCGASYDRRHAVARSARVGGQPGERSDRMAEGIGRFGPLCRWAPLRGAKIVLEIKVQLWPLGGLYEKTVYQEETVSHAEGRFVFKTARIPAIRRRPIVATVTASAPDRLTRQTWWWYSPQDMKGEPRFGTITLASGRMVSGRVVDATGAPVGDAVLHGYDTNFRNGRWVAGAIKADAKGRFRFRAPPVTESARGSVRRGARPNSSSCRKTRPKSKSSWSGGPRLTGCCLRKI